MDQKELDFWNEQRAAYRREFGPTIQGHALVYGGLSEEDKKEIDEKTEELYSSMTEEKFKHYSAWLGTADSRSVPNALENACHRWFCDQQGKRLGVLGATYRVSDRSYERKDALLTIAKKTKKISKQHIKDLKTIVEIESHSSMTPWVAKLAEKMIQSYKAHENFTSGLDKSDY